MENLIYWLFVGPWLLLTIAITPVLIYEIISLFYYIAHPEFKTNDTGPK